MRNDQEVVTEAGHRCEWAQLSFTPSAMAKDVDQTGAKATPYSQSLPTGIWQTLEAIIPAMRR